MTCPELFWFAGLDSRLKLWLSISLSIFGAEGFLLFVFCAVVSPVMRVRDRVSASALLYFML